MCGGVGTRLFIKTYLPSDVIGQGSDKGFIRGTKNEIETRLNEFQTADMRITLEFTRDKNRDKLQDFLNDFNCLQSTQRNFKARKWPEIISEIHIQPRGGVNIESIIKWL